MSLHFYESTFLYIKKIILSCWPLFSVQTNCRCLQLVLKDRIFQSFKLHSIEERAGNLCEFWYKRWQHLWSYSSSGKTKHIIELWGWSGCSRHRGRQVCVCVCVVTSQVPQTKLFSHYQQFSHSLFMIPALSSSTSDCFLLFSALPNRHSFTSILLCAVRPFYPFSKISFDLPLLHLVLNLSFAPLTLSLLFLSPVILLLSHNGSSVLCGKGRWNQSSCQTCETICHQWFIQ